ncbi:MAG: hypothetical protein IJ612_06680 [Prevotella sp.]|nr:hypothetical protein [Prevotella sp.]
MFKSIEGYEHGIPVEYTQNGNILTIEPQLLASGTLEDGSPLYAWLFGYTDDYTIKLTLNDDGSIVTPSNLEIIIGAFNTSTFTLSQTTYLGYYQWTENVKYSFEGQQEAESPFKDSYPGAGYEYFDKTNLTWTMTPQFADGEFESFIPTPAGVGFEEFFPNGYPASYTINGDKVIVSPESRLYYTDDEGNTVRITLFGYTGEDGYGDIVMTLGEDGSLTTAKGQEVRIGAFIGTVFDPTMEAFDGNYTIVQDLNFNGESTTPEEPGEELDIEVKETFTGYGDNFNGQDEPANAVQWTMKQGVLNENGQKLDVFVDMIPEPNSFVSLYPNGIPVEYTQTGSTILVEPQVIATTDNYYIILASGIAEDGVIALTVNSDGSLNTEKGEEIFIGAWETEKFDPTYDTYAGYYSIVENVKYVKEGQTITPEVEYEPEGMYLHAHYSPSFYGYQANYSIVPADGQVSFKNYTSDPVDTWSWSISTAETEIDPVIEVASGSERDFSFVTEAGQTYLPAVLKGLNSGNASDPYQWGLMGIDEETGEPNYEEAYLFAGEAGGSFAMSDGTYSIITKANPDFSVAYYGFLGTPDVNTSQYSLSSLVLYQGKPSVPLYIEGVNYLVRDFVAKDNFTLKCKLVKATRTAAGALTLGDVIAEADINIGDVWMGESTVAQLNWTEFYVEDEWGMSVTLDHLFIEDEFAVVIEGWDNGTFTANPYGEYDYNLNGLTSTFIKQTGDDAVYRFSSLYSRQLIGFTEAAYGYLLTEDDTNILLPAGGGQASIKVKPMLFSSDEETGERTTRLWLEDDSELPEWLDCGFANEQYGDEGDGTFELVFQADALPAGVDSREVELVFFQEGARLKVTVKQSPNGDGIATATAQPATDSKYYRLNGQQALTKKGIVVGKNRKFFVR